MKKVNLLSKAEMKNVLGGDIDLPGRCVQCECHSGGDPTCWYSKRTTSQLCGDVCSGPYFNALDGIGCEGCTMN